MSQKRWMPFLRVTLRVVLWSPKARGHACTCTHKGDSLMGSCEWSQLSREVYCSWASGHPGSQAFRLASPPGKLLLWPMGWWGGLPWPILKACLVPPQWAKRKSVSPASFRNIKNSSPPTPILSGSHDNRGDISLQGLWWVLESLSQKIQHIHRCVPSSNQEKWLNIIWQTIKLEQREPRNVPKDTQLESGRAWNWDGLPSHQDFGSNHSEILPLGI